jgi:hypothetical protein
MHLVFGFMYSIFGCQNPVRRHQWERIDMAYASGLSAIAAGALVDIFVTETVHRQR